MDLSAVSVQISGIPFLGLKQVEMTDYFALSDKRALITGASGGLGAHFAMLLAAQGATVAVAARRIADCEAVVAQIRQSGGKAIPVHLDVGKASSVEAALVEITGALGGVDILVNNAGVAETASLLEMEDAAFEHILDTNLTGAFRVARALARQMRDAGTGGAIVNIASILGLAVSGQVGAYATSKAALIQLTKSMALEWARHGIRVNALCPGYIETDINRDFFATDAGKAMIRRIPQRRLGQMQDLDASLLLLASEAGRYITGTTLAVDGGHLLSPL